LSALMGGGKSKVQMAPVMGGESRNDKPRARRGSLEQIKSFVQPQKLREGPDLTVKPGVVPEPVPAVETPRGDKPPRRGSLPMTEEEVRRARGLMKSHAATVNDSTGRRGADTAAGEPEGGGGPVVTQHAVSMMEMPRKKFMTLEEEEEEMRIERLRKQRKERRASIAAAEAEAAAKEYCKKCRLLLPDNCVCLQEKEREKQRQADAEFARQLARYVVPVVHDNRTLHKYAKEIEETPEYKEAEGGTMFKSKAKKELDKEQKRRRDRREAAKEETVVDYYIESIGKALTGDKKKKEHTHTRLNLCTHKMG